MRTVFTAFMLAFTMPAFASDIIVSLNNAGMCQAMVDGESYCCSIGKHGISKDKQEGDGRTPVGEFPIRRVLIRADKVNSKKLKLVSLPVQKIEAYDGWCDEATDKNYNQQVDLRKFDNKISHEKLRRDDDLYDIIAVVGYNDDPVIAGKGSAIFIHVARSKYDGTAGCVGFLQEDLLKILTKLDHNSKLIVQG